MTFLTFLSHYRRRDGNDRYSASRRIGPKLPKRFYAANPRQLDIHQHERWVLLTRELHTFFACPSLNGQVTLDLKRVPHELQVLGIVLDDEDQLIRHGAPAP
jgi:hypothetical protein